MRVPVRDQLIERLRMYAAFGVTTAVSLGSTPADELEGIRLRDEQRHVALDHARLFTGGLNACLALSMDCATPEDARKSVDRLADLHVDLIKFHINGVPTDMTPDVWGAIIDEAHKKQLPVFVHIFNLKDAQATVAKGVDVLAHSIRDQDVPREFIAELHNKGVAYIPTLTRDLSVFIYDTRPAFFDEPFFKRGLSLYGPEVQILSDPTHQEQVRHDPQAAAMRIALQQGEKNLKALADARVLIAMGTDSGVAYSPGRWQGYFEHVEVEMMVQAGMTPMQAIVAATSGAARAARLDADLGTLARGKLADLVVLNANPLDDIRSARQINSVWLAGHRLALAPAQTN
jgi:imidazolonepropionase-like amidohydrolase